jgi:hypothetical protein
VGYKALPSNCILNTCGFSVREPVRFSKNRQLSAQKYWRALVEVMINRKYQTVQLKTLNWRKTKDVMLGADENK